MDHDTVLNHFESIPSWLNKGTSKSFREIDERKVATIPVSWRMVVFAYGNLHGNLR